MGVGTRHWSQNIIFIQMIGLRKVGRETEFRRSGPQERLNFE